MATEWQQCGLEYDLSAHFFKCKSQLRDPRVQRGGSDAKASVFSDHVRWKHHSMKLRGCNTKCTAREPDIEVRVQQEPQTLVP